MHIQTIPKIYWISRLTYALGVSTYYPSPIRSTCELGRAKRRHIVGGTGQVASRRCRRSLRCEVAFCNYEVLTRLFHTNWSWSCELCDFCGNEPNNLALVCLAPQMISDVGLHGCKKWIAAPSLGISFFRSRSSHRDSFSKPKAVSAISAINAICRCPPTKATGSSESEPRRVKSDPLKA